MNLQVEALEYPLLGSARIPKPNITEFNLTLKFLRIDTLGGLIII